MRYLVRYFNGRSEREKIFDTLQLAESFKRSCPDPQATLWKEITDET